jgi:Protein of unknown function (DUF1572)
MSDPLHLTLTALHNRITRVFPAQIRECLAQLDDEQIWWRPNETSNSVGNLVLHLTGSLSHYLNLLIGGIDYRRDRAAEFAERRQIPKSEVLAMFDDMMAKGEQTFAGITPERLGAPSTDPEKSTLLIEDLLSIALHIATHTGQIIWITKMLREGSLHETWMRAHKREGAWKA